MMGPSEILILIQRGLFSISFGICLSSLWLVMKFIHSAGPFVFKGLGTERDRENICIRLATAGFRYLMLSPCSPWIRLFGEKQLDETFRAAAADGTPFVIANHNSMVDSLLVRWRSGSSFLFDSEDADFAVHFLFQGYGPHSPVHRLQNALTD